MNIDQGHQSEGSQEEPRFSANSNPDPEKQPSLPEKSDDFTDLSITSLRFLAEQFGADQEKILENYTEEEQAIILERLDLLRALGKYISKDFEVPVELNNPGEGWLWDFAQNKLFADPADLLQRPYEQSRFIICHDAGHRRISRVGVIPKEQWEEPGFAFLTNAIEDPRTNNFISSAYPVLRDDMDFVYNSTIEFERKVSQMAQDKLGYQPRFVTAGLEYIKQWFLETRGDGFNLPDDLPEEVRDVLEKTLEAAEDSWQHYPLKEECDKDEGLIRAYATRSFEINRDQIWPEFKKLVEQDLQDQKVQELLEEFSEQAAEEGKPQYPSYGGWGQQSTKPEPKEGDPSQKDFKESLTPEELAEFEEALKNARENSQYSYGKPDQAVPLDELSEELQQKLKDYFDSLSDEAREELMDEAREAIKEFERQMNEDMDKMFAEAEAEAEGEGDGDGDGDGDSQQEGQGQGRPHPSQQQNGPPGHQQQEDMHNPHTLVGDYEDAMVPDVHKDPKRFRKERVRLGTLIDKLESKLHQVFRDRERHRKKPNYKSGRNVNILTRLKEVARNVPPEKTRSFERREAPLKRDYAVTLLVDLSASMGGEKIEETFKSVVLVAEAMDRLGIRLEILGFNSHLHFFQIYGESLSNEVRERLGSMVHETRGERSGHTDDGWALAQASRRLDNVKAKNKVIIVCCDGTSNQSAGHNQEEFRLDNAINEVLRKPDQVLVALGIGPHTQQVVDHYPSGIGNVKTEDLPEKLAKILEQVIADYEKFRR